jgi:hypothetical protein
MSKVSTSCDAPCTSTRIPRPKALWSLTSRCPTAVMHSAPRLRRPANGSLEPAAVVKGSSEPATRVSAATRHIAPTGSLCGSRRLFGAAGSGSRPEGAARGTGVSARTPSGGRAYRDGLSGSYRAASALARRRFEVGFGRPRAAVRAWHSASTHRPIAAFASGEKRVWSPRSPRPRRSDLGSFGGWGSCVGPRSPPAPESSLSGTNRTAWWSSVTARVSARRPCRPSGWCWLARPRHDAPSALRGNRHGRGVQRCCWQPAHRAPASVSAAEWLRRVAVFGKVGDPLSSVGTRPSVPAVVRRASWRRAVGVEPGSYFEVGPKLKRGGLGGFPRSVGAV